LTLFLPPHPPSAAHTHTHVIIITIFGFIKWPEEMRSAAASEEWGKNKRKHKIK